MPRTKAATEEVQDDLIHQNMRFYGKVQNTPQDARKEITAGRLKGYTDINPMFRIKRLTEIFGPAGFGWWTQNEKFTFEECKTGEVAVFCEVELVVVDPDTKEVSHPIKGVGGNKFVANETKGPYCNDEAMKMAYTDALSIACKSLGFCHDIYYAKDRTKYSLAEDEANISPKPTKETKEANEPTPEEYKAIKDRIQKGIAKLSANMDTNSKNDFMQNVVVKHIGQVNYMTCMDMNKLQSLLAELLDMAKKAA